MAQPIIHNLRVQNVALPRRNVQSWQSRRLCEPLLSCCSIALVHQPPTRNPTGRYQADPHHQKHVEHSRFHTQQGLPRANHAVQHPGAEHKTREERPKRRL